MHHENTWGRGGKQSAWLIEKAGVRGRKSGEMHSRWLIVKSERKSLFPVKEGDNQRMSS